MNAPLARPSWLSVLEHQIGAARPTFAEPSRRSVASQATANSADSSGCFTMSCNNFNAATGGENRPCSQSRRVATGVPMRSAKSACVNPVFCRA